MGHGDEGTPDALLRIEYRSLGDQAFHPHASIEGVDRDFANFGAAVRLPEGLDFLLHGGDLLSHGGAQVRCIDCIAGAEACICHSRHQFL